MRTQDEIVARIREIKDADVFGFGRHALIDLLDYEHAKPFLKDGVTEEEWGEPPTPIESIKDYLEFAWEKAMNKRGLSAARSLMKLEQWAWASGDETLMGLVNSRSYADYGKRQLAAVCRHLGIDNWQEWATPDYLA